jgi:hypothetical protein
VVSAEVGVEEAVVGEEAEAEVAGAAVVRLVARLAVQLVARLVVRLAGLLPELAELLVARSAGAWVGSAV